jgi:hypothetical protein
MKTWSFLIILFLAFSSSCKDEEKEDPQICEDAITELSSKSFRGTIFLCNAQPPDMDFLDASATIISLKPDQISIHLESDSVLIDTIFSFSYVCNLAEGNIPSVHLKDEFDNPKGGYSHNHGHITFSFGYPNCLNNTHFRGWDD